MLRSNDLIWSQVVREYLMGERPPMTDLMAWNADATHMPYRMHANYIRHLFLDNDLAEGRLSVDGKPIALTDIRAPIFAVGTVGDHVAPSRSTYKIQLMTDTDVTYVFTSGGHNVGIVSQPGSEGHAFHDQAVDGSLCGSRNLCGRGPAQGRILVAGMGFLACGTLRPFDGAACDGRCGCRLSPLCEAPGTYVLQV